MFSSRQSKEFIFAILGIALLLLAVYVISLLLNPKLAYALTLVEQNVGTDLETVTSVQDGAFAQTLGTGLDGYPRSIQLKVKDPVSATGGAAFVQLACYSDAGYTTQNCGKIEWGYDDVIISGGYLYLDLTDNTKSGYVQTFVNFNPSKYYRLYVDYAFTGSSGGWYGSTNASSYANGSATFIEGTGGVADVYFKISNTADFTDSYSITLGSPPNGASAPDFSNWVLSLNSALTATNVKVRVFYGASTTPAFVDTRTFASLNSGGGFDFQVPKSRALSTGTYYAQAYLYVNDDLVGYSSQNQFTITTEGVPFITQFGDTFGGTSTVSNLNTTCDPNSSLFQNSLCKLVTFLFYPSPQALDAFTSLYGQVQDKFPFAYFYDFKSTIDGLSTDGTVHSQSITYVGTGTIPITVPLFSSSTVSAYVGNSNMDLLKNLMVWSIWILFGFHVYYRIAGLLGHKEA